MVPVSTDDSHCITWSSKRGAALDEMSCGFGICCVLTGVIKSMVVSGGLIATYHLLGEPETAID